jgi:hypothetical protein
MRISNRLLEGIIAQTTIGLQEFEENTTENGEHMNRKFKRSRLSDDSFSNGWIEKNYLYIIGENFWESVTALKGLPRIR